MTSTGGASAVARPAGFPLSALRVIEVIGRSLPLRAAALLIVLSLGSPIVARPEDAAGTVKNPFEGRADVVDEGRSLFNQYCAHCHGTNAFQGERPRDLRRLNIRYGARATQVFYETVSNGRLDKGMPVWKSVLADDVLWRIYTFLETVQTPP